MKKFLILIFCLLFAASAFAADYSSDKKVDGLTDVSTQLARTTNVLAQDANDTDVIGIVPVSAIAALVQLDDLSDVTGTGTADALLKDDGDGTYSFTSTLTNVGIGGFTAGSMIKADGSGYLTEATAGTDYQAASSNLDTLSSPTAWRLFYSNGTSVLTELALESSGQLLQSNGVSAAPSWTDTLSNVTFGGFTANRMVESDASGNLTSSSTTPTNMKTEGICFEIDGGGSAITTGTKGYIEVPFDATIKQVTMLADQSGSITVDIWKDTYANAPPTDADSITASAVPSISSATKSQDSTLTGWTTSISAGDILGFNVDSASTITFVTICLKVEK